jgi:hypothetical protein
MLHELQSQHPTEEYVSIAQDENRARDVALANRLETLSRHASLGGKTLRDCNVISFPIAPDSSSISTPSSLAVSPGTSSSVLVGMNSEGDNVNLPEMPTYVDCEALESAVRADRIDQVEDIISRAGGISSVSEANSYSEFNHFRAHRQRLADNKCLF